MKHTTTNPAKPGPAPTEIALATGLRMTRQRREVFDVIQSKRDHPTATEVFMRVKTRMPGISLATVYNCLETLTENGLILQVNLERAPTRYCPNLEAHGHFHCERCGAIADVPFSHPSGAAGMVSLPKGALVNKVEFSMRGTCPACTRKAARA